jgi:hypothetical protein
MELSPSWEAASCAATQELQHFMEPETSLLCSQKPSIRPYPGLDQYSPYHPTLSKIPFHIIHPHTS